MQTTVVILASLAFATGSSQAPASSTHLSAKLDEGREAPLKALATFVLAVNPASAFGSSSPNHQKLKRSFSAGVSTRADFLKAASKVGASLLTFAPVAKASAVQVGDKKVIDSILNAKFWPEKDKALEKSKPKPDTFDPKKGYPSVSKEDIENRKKASAERTASFLAEEKAKSEAMLAAAKR